MVVLLLRGNSDNLTVLSYVFIQHVTVAVQLFKTGFLAGISFYAHWVALSIYFFVLMSLEVEVNLKL